MFPLGPFGAFHVPKTGIPVLFGMALVLHAAFTVEPPFFRTGQPCPIEYVTQFQL